MKNLQMTTYSAQPKHISPSKLQVNGCESDTAPWQLFCSIQGENTGEVNVLNTNSLCKVFPNECS